jgi:hypothetical protein
LGPTCQSYVAKVSIKYSIIFFSWQVGPTYLSFCLNPLALTTDAQPEMGMTTSSSVAPVWPEILPPLVEVSCALPCRSSPCPARAYPGRSSPCPARTCPRRSSPYMARPELNAPGPGGPPCSRPTHSLAKLSTLAPRMAWPELELCAAPHRAPCSRRTEMWDRLIRKHVNLTKPNNQCSVSRISPNSDSHVTK